MEEKILVWLLRVTGGLASLAIVAVVMPTAWIDAGSRMSGLGEFPDTTLTQYLVRSVSLLYCMFGVFTLYLSRDVRRQRRVIVFVGWMTVLLGVGLTAIDFALGMPSVWSWGEGPPTILVGAAFVRLAGRLPERV